MRHDELKQILKKQPFEPLQLGLSDGRRVVIRHPDTIVVSPRHVYIGLTAVSRRGVPETPANGDTFISGQVPVARPGAHHLSGAGEWERSKHESPPEAAQMRICLAAEALGGSNAIRLRTFAHC